MTRSTDYCSRRKDHSIILFVDQRTVIRNLKKKKKSGFRDVI